MARQQPALFPDLPSDSDTTQQALAAWNRARLAPGVPPGDWETQRRTDQSKRMCEARFIEAARAKVAVRAAAVSSRTWAVETLKPALAKRSVNLPLFGSA